MSISKEAKEGLIVVAAGLLVLVMLLLIANHYR